MYCLKCGKEIADNVKECPFCGCITENEIIDAELSLEQNNDIKKQESLATTAIVLGIIAAVVAFLLAFVGYIFAGISLTLSIISLTKNKHNKKSKTALVVSIVAFVCCVTSSIIGVIMMT